MAKFWEWRARVAPVFSSTGTVLNTVLPYHERLEEIAGRYNVWRVGAEPSSALARRAALAACEEIETRTREVAAIETDLDELLAFEREARICES
jgi:hypothetical protein